MKLKKLIKRISITVLSVILIFLISFMIGSDFGRRPLFFVNVRTVEKVVRYNRPVTEKTKYETSDFYYQAMYINKYKDVDCVLSYKNYKTYEAAHVYEFHLKPFGKVKVENEFGFDENGNSMGGKTFAVVGPFVFEMYK